MSVARARGGGTSGQSSVYTIVENRVFYVALSRAPQNTSKALYFCTDSTLVYWNFFLDFGPLNLGQLYRFCELLNSILADPKHAKKKIYYYSSSHSHRRANSVTLITAWAMLFLGRTPEEAYAPFVDCYPPFPPFHDASPCVCTFKLNILDVLRGINRARQCGFFDFDNFDIEEFEHFEKVENGDLTWVTDRICAFAGPHNTHSSSVEGYYTLTPEDYIPHFKKKKVNLIIRLNKKYYDETRFTRQGMRHADLYYLDGSTPTAEILENFLNLVESVPEGKRLGVHCKAGLGRTGSCIGAWLMKHKGFTAREVIGWLRCARPGSVIGPQQHWLERMEEPMRRAGEAFRARARGASGAESKSSAGLRSGSGGKGAAGAAASPGARSSSKADERSQGDFLRSRRSPKATRS